MGLPASRGKTAGATVAEAGARHPWPWVAGCCEREKPAEARGGPLALGACLHLPHLPCAAWLWRPRHATRACSTSPWAALRCRACSRPGRAAGVQTSTLLGCVTDRNRAALGRGSATRRDNRWNAARHACRVVCEQSGASERVQRASSLPPPGQQVARILPFQSGPGCASGLRTFGTAGQKGFPLDRSRGMGSGTLARPP
jgi:hypothetical protein